MEDIYVAFHIKNTDPELLVLFKKWQGVRTKEAVVVVIYKASDESLICSTGFDADSCSMFEMLLDSSIGFAGCLRKDDQVIGDIHIDKNIDGHFLTVTLGGNVRMIRLENEDISELTTLFNLVGGTHEAPAH